MDTKKLICFVIMNRMTQPKKASTLEILVSIIDCMIQNSCPKVVASSSSVSKSTQELQYSIFIKWFMREKPDGHI